MYSDYHVHSAFSGDSTAQLKDIINTAIDRKMSSICITDHMDIDFPGENPLLFTFDIEKYFSTLISLKDEYKDKIDIRIGVEVGLQPHLADEIAELTNHPFDFIIGSSHIVNGKDPYYEDYYISRSEYDALNEYFECICKCIDATNNFDVYGHLDYIVRYSPSKNDFFSYEKFKPVIDKILNKLISRGKGIEINTAGYDKGLNSPNPCKEIIKRYHELGGRIITIGSDAHIPQNIGSHFTEAACLLKDCGFKYYTVFKNRKPSFIKL